MSKFAKTKITANDKMQRGYIYYLTEAAGKNFAPDFLPELLEECKKLGGCKTGETKITKGYNLPAKYVIHTVGPVYGQENGNEEKLLAGCYKNCLQLAKENNIKTIAFPAISTGAYGYPKNEAAKIALAAVKEFCAVNSDSFDQIIFVCFDNENYEIYKKLC
jgi:O-acetyl-ADP-ribose deacetylase (regulator of RNase III)